MSISPDSANPSIPGSVTSFEYQQAGGFGADGPTITGQSSKSGVFQTSSKDDLDRLIAAARAEGAQQVQQAFEKELQAERTRIATELREFAHQKAKYYTQVEVELVHLALGIASKILHREAQVDRLLVAGLVKVALEKINQRTNVTVRVAPQEAADWNHYFHTHLEGEFAVNVQADSAIAPHNCVLETELGSTELGLDAQLKEVEQGFFDLLAQRPEKS